jgi:hypothetical protein
MSSISPTPQGEVGQSHSSRHTGLGSEVRGEPSAADARGAHARHSTLQSVTATTTTQTQPRMVQSSPRTSHEGVTGAAGRDFANQSVPIYGLDSRMPPSASSRDVTNSDAYATPAPLACAFGNPTTGTASGAPPTTTDGLSSTRLHFPATIASERSLSMLSHHIWRYCSARRVSLWCTTPHSNNLRPSLSPRTFRWTAFCLRSSQSVTRVEFTALQ